MNKKELIKQIQKIINLDGDKYTDREVIDMILNLIEKKENE